MQVLIDDNPCEVPATTISQAIHAAAALAEQSGRLITDVHVDGVHLSEQQIAELDQEATADLVSLVSADPSQLVGGVFGEAAEALQDADELQREAAELLQSGEHTVAMDRLGDAVSIWLAVQQAIVKGAQLLGINLDEVIVNDIAVPAAIVTLNEQLQIVRSALVNADSIELADVLLYEFPRIVEQWRQILAALEQRISREDES